MSGKMFYRSTQSRKKLLTQSEKKLLDIHTLSRTLAAMDNRHAEGGSPESDVRDDSAVETRVATLRKEYDEALSQLKNLREQQRLLQAQRLLDAMDKKGI